MKKKRDIHAKSQQVRSNQSLIINYMVGIGIFFLELLLYLKYNFVLVYVGSWSLARAVYKANRN